MRHLSAILGVLATLCLLMPAEQGRAQTPPKKEVLKLSHGLPVGHPLHAGALKFKEILEQKTNKNVTVEIYPANQLGSPREQFEQAYTATVDIAVVTVDLPTFLGQPYWRLLESGYIYKSYDHATKFFQSPLMKSLTDKLEKEKGVTVVDIPWYYGLRQLTTANKPIVNPEDLKGLKIRVPEAPGYMNTLKGMGADITPVAFNELYMALKTGVVDGQENPFATIYTYKFYEPQKYLNLTGHLRSYNAAFVNTKRLKSLSPEYQQAFASAMRIAVEYNDKLIQDSEADYLNKLKEVGMKVVEPNREAFRERAVKYMQEKWYTPEEYEFYKKLQDAK